MSVKRMVITALLALLVAAPVMAQDVQVDGYYRSDGTYVRPHVRSAPDSSISNNYGPSQNTYQLQNPRSRDYDNDGTPNFLDQDSDNDGIGDERDSNPYSGSNW